MVLSSEDDVECLKPLENSNFRIFEQSSKENINSFRIVLKAFRCLIGKKIIFLKKF